MKSTEFLTKVVIGENSSAKPWSASDIESGRGSHFKNDKLEPGDKFEYGYFNEPKGNGTVIELVGGIGKESINAKLDDGRIVKMPYLGSKPKNGYYIRKIINKNVDEDFEKNVQDYAKLEKFVEFAKNKLESASGSTLDLVAKKLSEYEAENFVNDIIEKNVYKTRGYGFTPIITQLYLDEREKRGIEDTSNKPNSVNYVNTPFGAISGPEAYWDVEISKWGGANGREIANDLINAGYVENKKEFLYMISLVKTMPELRQEIEDSGIKVGSLDEYIFYAKELKGQGLIGNQEYLNSPYNDEKLEKALAKQMKESKEQLDENLHKWFKEKWVRFGPDGKIRGACARGDDSEGKPKCLPQAKAHALGKKGRKYAAAKKRREDPNPERSGKAINVATKKKSNEGVLNELSPELLKRASMAASKKYDIAADYGNKLPDNDAQALMKHYKGQSEKFSQGAKSAQQRDAKKNTMNKLNMSDVAKRKTGVKEAELDEACWKGYHKEGNKKMFGKTYPNCVKNTNEEQLDEKCWDTHKQVGMKSKGGKMVPNCVPKESVEEGHQQCPECGGPMFSELLINEKKDACYYKVKSRYKVWPSAYASGALVKCRKKGAKNWGTKSESQLDELSPETLASYKKKAGQQASELDKAAFSGDKDAKAKIAKANKRFSGIVKATKKEFDKPKDKVDEFVQGYNMGQAGYRKFKPKHVPNQDEIQKMSGVMKSITQVDEKWSQKYKNSINCSNPKGFSQRAHCQGRKK